MVSETRAFFGVRKIRSNLLITAAFMQAPSEEGVPSMQVKRVRDRRVVAGVIGFVAVATVMPAVAVPIGSAVLAASAFGLPRVNVARFARSARRTAARITHPAALAAGGVILLLLALAIPAASYWAGPDAAADSGVGIARLRVYPEGETGDPNLDDSYVGPDPDPWIEDSWVILVDDDTAAFGINITNRHGYQSFDVFMRIAVNDLALFDDMTLTIAENGDASHQGDSESFTDADFAIGTPTLKNGASWPSHGVYPTAFTSFEVGGIGAFGSANDTIVIDVEVNGAFTDGLKVHFDADGWTILPNQGQSPILSDDPNDSNIRNPNSADTTVQIPSVTSIVLPAAAVALLYAIVGRRRRKAT